MTVAFIVFFRMGEGFVEQNVAPKALFFFEKQKNTFPPGILKSDPKKTTMVGFYTVGSIADVIRIMYPPANCILTICSDLLGKFSTTIQSCVFDSEKNNIPILINQTPKQTLRACGQKLVKPPNSLRLHHNNTRSTTIP